MIILYIIKPHICTYVYARMCINMSSFIKLINKIIYFNKIILLINFKEKHGKVCSY